MKKNEQYHPDYILYLQPTSPMRTADDIDQSINIAKEKNANSVVSVELTNRHPYFMKKIDSNGLISHYEKQIFPTPRRQELEPIYVLNGAIFLFRTKIPTPFLKGRVFNLVFTNYPLRSFRVKLS